MSSERAAYARAHYHFNQLSSEITQANPTKDYEGLSWSDIKDLHDSGYSWSEIADELGESRKLTKEFEGGYINEQYARDRWENRNPDFPDSVYYYHGIFA